MRVPVTPNLHQHLTLLVSALFTFVVVVVLSSSSRCEVVFHVWF